MDGWLAGILMGCAVLLAGCTSGMQCHPSSDPLERDRCTSTGGAPEAAVTAVAAGAAWGVEGCNVNGCNPPYTCNSETGMCERLRCGEGEACPAPFECNLLRGRCE